MLTRDAMTLLLPVVLAIHNAEEFAQYDRFAKTFQGRLPAALATRAVGGGAMVLLTVAAAVLAGAAVSTENGSAYATVKVAVFALLWNSLGHGVLSLRHKAVVPGTVTAMLVVLPYGVFAVLAMREHGDSARRLLTYALAGAAALPAVVLAAAVFSYGVLRLAELLRRTLSA